MVLLGWRWSCVPGMIIVNVFFVLDELCFCPFSLSWMGEQFLCWWSIFLSSPFSLSSFPFYSFVFLSHLSSLPLLSTPWLVYLHRIGDWVLIQGRQAGELEGGGTGVVRRFGHVSSCHLRRHCCGTHCTHGRLVLEIGYGAFGVRGSMR